MNNLITKLKFDYLLLLLLCLATILIFSYSWLPGGLDVDSCNYAVIAKEILRTNKWLNLYDPVYQGVFYYHFPLCIWAAAVLFKIFGVSTFTAKLFSMLCGIALAVVIFYFGKLLKNRWVGFFAGASFLFTNHIVRLARQCRMDIPVSLFITLAVLSFFLAQRRSQLYYLLFGLFTSLAIFTKDVFGLAPLAIVFIYLVIRWHWKELFHPLFILGLFIALAPVLVWIRLDHKTLFEPWWRWNFLYLLKSPRFSVPWYYYLWAITTKYFYFLLFAIYGGYLAFQEGRKNKNFEFYLLIIWVLIFPIAFSFGRQKLHYFILPMYPAASLLVGIAFDKIFRESIKLKITSGLKYILIAMAIIILSFPLPIRSKRFSEIIHLAPAIDQILKQIPEYDFVVYKQDVASLLFYSQELARVKYIKDETSLENELATVSNKPRLCYLNEQNFSALDLSIRQKYRVILKHKDRIVILSPADLSITVVLP